MTSSLSAAPESNSALAAWQDKLGFQSSGGLFRIAGQDHASETEALVFAAANPLDRHHMVWCWRETARSKPFC